MEFIYDKNGRASVTEKNFSFKMDLPQRGCFTLAVGKKLVIESLLAKPGDFSEELALENPRRLHRAENGLELSIDAKSPIPFGAPHSIERKYRISDGEFNCVNDLVLGHSFEMKDIDAGGLAFENVDSFSFMLPPENGIELSEKEMTSFADIADGQIVYEGKDAFLSLTLKTADGIKTVFGTAGDYWRWVNALRIDGISRFTLVRENNKLVYKWHIYTFVPAAPDALPPSGRNWRMTYFIEWKNENAKPDTVDYKDTFDVSTFEFPKTACAMDAEGNRTNEVCFSAAPAINILKKWLRSKLAEAAENDVYALINTKNHFCCDASHMERPKLGKLPHWDRGPFKEFVRWANRRLAASGAKLVVIEK